MSDLKPSSDSEPDSYSIDEMMKSLKVIEPREKDGKLVTRSDGTQAMKVRKRKRRSQQKKKSGSDESKQKSQILQIVGIVIGLAVLGLAVGALIVYANSAIYRNGLVEKLNHATGGDVELRQFRMNPARAKVTEVGIEWPDGNYLRQLRVTNVDGKQHPFSFFGKTFRGEEIVANAGFLELGAGREGGRFWSHDLKKKASGVTFDRYAVRKLDIFLGANRSMGNVLTQTEASFYPGGVQGREEIRLRSGLLNAIGWPQLELDRAYMNVIDGGIKVRSFRLLIPRNLDEKVLRRGKIEFAGTFRPTGEDQSDALEVTIESFSLPYLIGKDLGNFFMGRVETKAQDASNLFYLQPGADVDAKLSVSVSNNLDSRIELVGFKFLSQLAYTINDTWYQKPYFTNTSFAITRAAESVEIEEFELTERGRMAVRGKLMNGENGSISGTLRVGIPETMLVAGLDKRLRELFSEEKDGFRWLDIEVGGTSSVPLDNFKALYDETNPRNVIDEAPAAERQVDSFEALIGGD